MAPTPSSTVSERVSSFVADNKRALLVGAAAVVAVGSVGYYLYSSSSSSSAASGSAGPTTASPDPSARNEAPAGAAKKKSKKKKSPKGKPAAEGPILEERKPKPASVDTVPETIADLEPRLTEDAIGALSVAERTSLAADFKSRGNDAYKAKKYELAAELYTRAIDAAARPDAMFYSNRSACYLYFKPPRHDLVVQDCNSALAIDKTYVKPLARRANAYEALGNLQEALNDFTAAVILDRFQTSANNTALDRVLKALAQQKAAETIKNRTLRLPSTTFITAFFASFRKQKRPALPEAPSEGDKTFQEALDGLEACDYAKAFDRVKSALNSDSPISDPRVRAYALNLRGTFQFLMGDAASAKTSFEESIAAAPKYANSYVKLASVHMDLGDSEGTFKTYEAAIAADPKDPDVYYQRGQVFFIMGDFTLASADYQKSIDLDKDFVFSHIQLAVAQYKLGNIGKSMATFRSTMRNFPNMSEPLNYYGELLLDQGKFDEAVQKFEEAIAIENAKPAHTANVLPLVNKGLALFQWKNDIGAAESHCQQALERDPECEAAIATLAQLLLQHSRLREACDMFRRHVAIGRSEMEIQATLNYLLATEAQLHFVTNYPEKADLLSEVAKALQ